MQESELPSDKLPPSTPPVRQTGALRLVAEDAKPLSRRQRQFNRLVTQIENLRKEVARTRTQMEALLAEYVARIHPLRTEEHRVRREVVRALAVAWRKPTGLGRRQRATLRDLLLAQYDFLEEHPPGPEDADLFILLDELERDAELEAEARQENRRGLLMDDDKGVFDPDTGEDDDGSNQEPAMSEEEILRAFAQQFSGGIGGASTTDGPPPSHRRTAAQKRQEQREAELEEARKRGVATIYKQLAKVLHPDLERDPVRRAEKMKLMQQLTEAHRAGDLHTLLRLELEFIHGEERRSWELGEEKLALYCDLLKEQVAELQGEKNRLVFDPRYAVFVQRYWPCTPRLSDLEDWAAQVRAVIDSLTASQVRLDSPEGKAEIRDALAAFKVRKRQVRRAPLFDDFF